MLWWPIVSHDHAFLSMSSISSASVVMICSLSLQRQTLLQGIKDDDEWLIVAFFQMRKLRLHFWNEAEYKSNQYQFLKWGLTIDFGQSLGQTGYNQAKFPLWNVYQALLVLLNIDPWVMSLRTDATGKLLFKPGQKGWYPPDRRRLYGICHFVLLTCPVRSI